MFLPNLFNSLQPDELQPVEGNSCRVASLFQLPEHQFQVPENQSKERIDSFSPWIEAINTEAGANSSNPGTVAGANPEEVFNSWLEAGANPEEVSIGTELKSLAADPKALKEALKDPEALKKAINNALQQDPEAFKSIVKSLESNLNKVGEDAIVKKDLSTILNTIEIGTLIKNLRAEIPQEVSRAGANTEDATEADANPETRTHDQNRIIPDLNSRDYTPDDARRLAVLGLLKREEGLETTAYPDGSRYSIGLGTESKPGERITKEEAFRRAEKYVAQTIDPHLDDLERQRDKEFTLGQRAALTSFFFNYGNNVPDVNQAIISGNNKILTEILKRKDKGGRVGEQTRRVLAARRQREIAIFNGQIPPWIS